MTTISSMAAPPATRSTLGGLAGNLVNGLVAYWVRRQAVKALSELDDRGLRDIGITRSHIEAAVYGGTMNPESGRLR